MFQIEFTPEALEDLQLLRVYDQQQIIQAIETQPMKTIVISQDSTEIHALFEQACDEDIVVKLADGREFILSAIDDFDIEVAQTRRNEKLMALLDKRALTDTNDSTQ